MAFEEALVQAVEGFHSAKGDRHIELVAWYTDKGGNHPLLLTRYVNAGNVSMSSLLECKERKDDDWDIFEMFSALWADEARMIHYHQTHNMV